MSSDRRVSRDDGFTLVELMVVLLIVATLAAIIIPSYLGARERSQDRAAQVNLNHALDAAKVVYSDYASYGPLACDAPYCGLPPTDVLRAATVEPRIEWRNQVQALHAPHQIGFSVDTGSFERRYNQILLTALSDTDVCWAIWDHDELGTYYGHADLEGLNDQTVSLTCQGLMKTRMIPPFPNSPPPRSVQLLTNPPLGFIPQIRNMCWYSDGWQPIYRTGTGTARYACPPDEPLPRS